MSKTKQPEALRLADELDAEAGRITQYTNRPGDLLRELAADELRRLHAENTTLQQGYAAARLEIESLRAAQPVVAQQPGAAYAALPDGVATLCEYGGDVFTAAQMRAFADATYTIRASHGQAPAQAAPAAVAGPSGYGPKVTVKRRCSDCKACNSESYAVQGDSGHYVYCGHPSLPESKYIGDTNWNTPHWCPVSAPTTQPAPQQEAQEPVAWQSRTRPTWGGNDRPWSPWEPCTKGLAEDCWKTPLLHDWAYEARALYTAPQPSPASQVDTEDAARLNFLIEHQAYVVSDETCVYGYWLHYAEPGGTTSVQVGEYETPREAIDAARAAQEGK